MQLIEYKENLVPVQNSSVFTKTQNYGVYVPTYLKYFYCGPEV